MYIKEINCEVKDAAELSEAFSDILDEFCDDLGMQPDSTRPIGEDDPYIEGCKFMWTDSAMKAIEAEEKRLYAIAQSYYPGEDTPIETTRVKEA